MDLSDLLTAEKLKMIKSNWMKNDLANNSDQAPASIGTPPDMKTFVARTARFVAKNGLRFEKSIMNNKLLDARVNYNFLRSSEDSFHGYYQQKLTEYLSQIEEHGDIIEPDDHDDDVASDEIIEPPPGTIRTIIENATRYLSTKGLEAEKVMMDRNGFDANYSFMRRSDPFYPFYRQKLSEYRSQNQHDGANNQVAATTDSHEVDAQADLVQYEFIAQPDLGLPKGMNLKEFVAMKLTAQFAAWYGSGFWMKLMGKAGFEYTNPTDCRFEDFSRFVLAYSKVFRPPRDLTKKLSKSDGKDDDDAYMAAVLDGFFRLLEWDSLGEMKWREGGVKSMIDWHASLEKDFAYKVAQELTPPGTGTSEEREPKRQKVNTNPLSL